MTLLAGVDVLAVEEVGCHEELQGYLRGDGELRDGGGAHSIASLGQGSV